MWFKVDDKFLRHPKTLAAGRMLGGDRPIGRIASVWLEAGLYASEWLTDGFIPAIAVASFVTDTDPVQVMDVCARARLFHKEKRNGEPGYTFHDWQDHNPTAQDVKTKRARDRDRKKRRAAENQTEFANGQAVGFLAEFCGDVPDVIDGVVTESETIPRGFLAESNATPSGVASDSTASRARDPVPSRPVPSPNERAEGQASRRCAPLRVPVQAVLAHLHAAVHRLVASGPPYVDAAGQVDRSELREELKVIAVRYLQAEWEGRELEAILDGALARRELMAKGDSARARFRVRERRLLRRAGRLR